MPVFRFKIVERIYVMAYSWLIYSVLTKHQGIMAATLGRTRESIDESLYVNASQESIRNSVISEIGYQYKFMSFNNTKSYILHGDAERFAAIKVHRLKKKGIHFKHKMFRNTGHAELIHKDPRILLSIIDKAYIDKL
jgi:hypothetical protein